MTARELLSLIARVIRNGMMAVLSPVLEKNFVKTLAFDTPVIFSMSRLIVLAFAVGMLHQLWHAGITGWPEATLAIAIVLALPLVSALERVDPTRVVDLVTALAGRFGVGGIGNARPLTNPPTPSREPSKFDDHHDDT